MLSTFIHKRQHFAMLKSCVKSVADNIFSMVQESIPVHPTAVPILNAETFIYSTVQCLTFEKPLHGWH